jgi:2-polyprenyl-3-methyl-5-hydroxy-6-metoxy-1,4-benzoquinol methylase
MNPFIQLPKVPVIYGRVDLILERCRGKRVLHLGCVDTGLINERLKGGELMHQKLAVVSNGLWGVDINPEGISLLREEGFNNLIIGDICHLDQIELLGENTFDVIVASEVMEHLQNPGLFLEGVKTLMRPGETELILTVPNAFRIDTFLRLFRRVEFIHPDHYYWFSYYTLTHFLQKKGFEIENVYVYSFQRIPRLSAGIRNRSQAKSANEQRGPIGKMFSCAILFVKRLGNFIRSILKSFMIGFLLKINPFFGDGIIIVARVDPHGL